MAVIFLEVIIIASNFPALTVYASYHFKLFIYSISVHPQDNPIKYILLLLSLTNEETKTERG